MRGVGFEKVQVLLPGLLALVIFLVPWGGGGTSSVALLVLHSLILASVVATLLMAPSSVKAPAALWMAAGFAAWCVVGAVRATYTFGSLTTAWDILMALGIFWVAWRVGGSPRARGLIVGTVIVAALLQAVLALAQGLSDPLLRSAGTFVNANRTAAFLNLALCLILARARSLRQARWVTASVLLLGVQFWPVASRGALAAMLLVGATYLMVHASTRRSRWIAATLTLGMFLAGAVAVAYRFAGSEDVYRYARLDIWRSSWAAVTERPLAGLGPGMFEHVAERYNFPRSEGPVRFGKHFSSTHNQYLEVLVETGVVGLMGFLTLAILLGRGLLRPPAGPIPGGRSYRNGVLLGLAVVGVHGFVEPLLLSPAIALTLAILAGSALATQKPLPRTVRWRPFDRRLLVPAVLTLVALFYATVLAPFLADRHFVRLDSAGSLGTFRRELAGAWRHNPFQPYYYQRAADRLLDTATVWNPASYALCYDYASKAVALNETDPWLHVGLARVNRRGSVEVFGDRTGLAEAVGHYRQAVALSVSDPRPAAEMSAFLLRLGKNQEAIDVAMTAIGIEPHFLDAHRLRITALERLGSEQELVQAQRDLEESRAVIGSYHPANDYESVILAWRKDDAFQRQPEH